MVVGGWLVGWLGYVSELGGREWERWVVWGWGGTGGLEGCGRDGWEWGGGLGRRRRTQSAAVSFDARSRTAEGREASGAERALVQWVIRALVTVERQSTTVPKTSKRRAEGGLVVDMMREWEDVCKVCFYYLEPIGLGNL